MTDVGHIYRHKYRHIYRHKYRHKYRHTYRHTYRHKYMGSIRHIQQNTRQLRETHKTYVTQDTRKKAAKKAANRDRLVGLFLSCAK